MVASMILLLLFGSQPSEAPSLPGIDYDGNFLNKLDNTYYSRHGKIFGIR